MSKGFLFELSKQAYEAQRRERTSLPILMDQLCPEGAARLKSIAYLREMRSEVRQLIDQLRADGKPTDEAEDLQRRITGLYRAALRDWVKSQRPN